MNFNRKVDQILSEAGILAGIGNVVSKTASAIGTGIAAAKDPTVVINAMKNINSSEGKDGILNPISAKSLPASYKGKKYIIFNTKNNEKIVALFNGDGKNPNKVDANGNFYVTPVAGPDQSQPLIYCFAKTAKTPQTFNLYKIMDLKSQIQGRKNALVTVPDPKTGTPTPQVCPAGVFQDIGINGGVPMVLVGATTPYSKWYDYQGYIKSFNPKGQKPAAVVQTQTQNKA
jgi:hypothetical protein